MSAQHVPRSRSGRYRVTQRKGSAYFAPIIEAALCVKCPRHPPQLTDTQQLRGHPLFAPTFRATHGFYGHNRTRSRAVRAPVPKESGQSRGWAPSPADSAPVGQTRGVPPSSNTLLLTDQNTLLLLGTNRLCVFERLPKATNTACSPEPLLRHYSRCSCFKTLLMASRGTNSSPSKRPGPLIPFP